MRNNHKLLRSLIVKVKTMRNSGMLNSSEEMSLCSQIESIGHALVVNDRKQVLVGIDKMASEILSVVNKSI